MKEEFLKLSKELDEAPFIKTYPILRYLDLTAGDKKLLNYILSYQLKGDPCYPNQAYIANICELTHGSVKSMISVLKRKKIIITDNKKNFNKHTGKGGSKSTYLVNLKLIEEMIRSNPDFQRDCAIARGEEIPTAEVVTTPVKKETPQPSERMGEVITQKKDESQVEITRTEEMEPALGLLKNYLKTVNGMFKYNTKDVIDATGLDKNTIVHCMKYLIQEKVVLRGPNKCIVVASAKFESFYGESLQQELTTTQPEKDIFMSYKEEKAPQDEVEQFKVEQKIYKYLDGQLRGTYGSIEEAYDAHKNLLLDENFSELSILKQLNGEQVNTHQGLIFSFENKEKVRI